MRDSSGIKGKTILFVNSGGKKKQFTLERAKRLGATVLVLNQTADFRRQHVDHFIETNTYNHDESCEKLHAFLESNPGIALDGALTFWEDDIPLLGRICEEFGLIGNSVETSINTRNKYEMRRRLADTGLGNPRFMLVKSKTALQEAMRTIGFPAVMKPAWGADSEFVVLVKDREEAETTLRYLIANCTEQFNPIFKYNDGLFLFEEYMEGMEVSVECYSQYGIPNVIGINEKQPIKLPYFVEYGDIAPARIDDDTEQQVTKLAESALIALGVKDSLSHIEIKITPDGPKIVEVGSRMGGDDIYFNVKQVWGVDMVEVGLKIAVGAKVSPKRKPPRDCMICRYFIPKHSGIISNINMDKKMVKHPNLVHLAVTKNVGDAVLVPPEGFENAGWLVTRGKTYQEAETLLNTIQNNIEINVTKFHKDSFLGRTSREHPLDTASLVRSEILRASRLAKLRSGNTGVLRKLHIGIAANSPTGELARAALAGIGYKASLINVQDLPLPIRKIQSANYDFVLNFCESSPASSQIGEHVASLLAILQIPYSGSNASTMSIALDKVTVKKLLDYHEIPTPEWDYLDNMNDSINQDLQYPLIVKPAELDDYQGIHTTSVVTNESELQDRLQAIIKDMGQPALVEEYIEGDEITACILGNEEEAEVLPLIRSTFDRMPEGYWHIYSSELKTKEFESLRKAIRVEKPAKISPKLNQLVSEMALDMFTIFDCADYAEIEMRIDRDGNPYVLEINLNPGFDPDDFFPQAAQLAGYSYSELLEGIIFGAARGYREPALLLEKHAR